MNSPDIDSLEPPPDDALAGEYVLRVLEVGQQRALQARVESDRTFAAAVATWERRLAPLLNDVAPVEPPAHVWSSICARLGWNEPAPDKPRAGLWANLGFWRVAAAFCALAAVGALWVATLPTPGAPPPQNEAALAKLVTPLRHDDGSPGWLATVDAAKGTVLMVPVPAAPDPQGRVPELWLIPPGQAPRSLGQVSINKAHTVVVPQDVRAALVSGSVLAITLEPAAGMPHAAPSSTPIAKGAIRVEGTS